MTTPPHASPTGRRWWQVWAAAAVLVVVALLSVVALSRSTIAYALPGGTGSTTFAPGMVASVVTVLCAAALVILLVLVCRHGRPGGQFWVAALVPLVIAIAVTTYAVNAVTPDF